MSRSGVQSQTAILLIGFDQAYGKRSWHGPNLRGSLRGLSAADAAWRPAANRHSIAEQTLHAAYWKYVVRRRLAGEKRGSFALTGSNWFPVMAPLSDRAWRDHLALLEAEHERLRTVIAALDDAALHRSVGGLSPLDLVLGVTAHDLYHAGQINLLKRIARETGEST